MFLKAAGLTAVPQYLARIEVARYLGVPPWALDDVPVIWQHWGAIALDVHNTLSTPPEKG